MKTSRLILVATIAMHCSCGDKPQQSEPMKFEEMTDPVLLYTDTTATTLQDTTPAEPAKSSSSAMPPAHSTPHYSTPSSDDNMRGFDPSSEDDMDDNGMSRYMENYDDEGWD
ncbi:MAG: hypothetical protein IJS89_00360 [Bacteroidaceae bacterium]|nr:hypothetical protein [Bacteroidaceae bacterium]